MDRAPLDVVTERYERVKLEYFIYLRVRNRLLASGVVTIVIAVILLSGPQVYGTPTETAIFFIVISLLILAVTIYYIRRATILVMPGERLHPHRAMVLAELEYKFAQHYK